VVGQDLQGLTPPQRSVAGALLGPATLAVVLGLLVPLAILFRYSFNRFVPGRLMVEALTVENYVKFFTDPYYVAILVRTLRVSAVCMVLCLVMGFPLAYALARTRSRWKSALVMLVVLPLFVGNAVRAAGWMVMFGSRGLLNTLLALVGLIDRPLQLMYTEAAVIVGITAVNLPFMVLTLESVIEGIDPAIEEAAASLGARPLQVCLPPCDPAAGDAGHPCRHDPRLHPRHERLRDTDIARRAQISDDGPARLRPVCRAEQLALRRRALVHPDDRDALPERRFESRGATPLPPLDRRRRRVRMRGGGRGPTEAYAAYASGRGLGRQRSRRALIGRLRDALRLTLETRARRPRRRATLSRPPARATP
jgi:ABC-type spermidine/putrescine transport system permease subunit II